MWRQNQRLYRDKQQAQVVVGEAPESSDEDDDEYEDTEEEFHNPDSELEKTKQSKTILNVQKVCFLDFRSFFLQIYLSISSVFNLLQLLPLLASISLFIFSLSLSLSLISNFYTCFFIKIHTIV